MGRVAVILLNKENPLVLSMSTDLHVSMSVCRYVIKSVCQPFYQNVSVSESKYSRADNEPALVKCSLPHRPLPKVLWIESPLAVDLTVGLAAVAEEDVQVVRRHLADLACPDIRHAVL